MLHCCMTPYWMIPQQIHNRQLVSGLDGVGLGCLGKGAGPAGRVPRRGWPDIGCIQKSSATFPSNVATMAPPRRGGAA